MGITFNTKSLLDQVGKCTTMCIVKISPFRRVRVSKDPGKDTVMLSELKHYCYSINMSQACVTLTLLGGVTMNSIVCDDLPRK